MKMRSSVTTTSTTSVMYKFSKYKFNLTYYKMKRLAELRMKTTTPHPHLLVNYLAQAELSAWQGIVNFVDYLTPFILTVGFFVIAIFGLKLYSSFCKSAERLQN